MFLPFLGVVYGVSAGAYIRSEKKTPKKRVAIWSGGILLLLMCATVLTIAFMK